ncbi:MAG: isopenicillin N synthase family dioxygenase [Opitutales bacterium]
MTEIPIIDLSPFTSGDEAARQAASAEIDRAAREVGFMYLKNYDVPPEVLETMKATGRQFFSRSTEEKIRNAYNQEDNFGYGGMGSEALDPSKPRDLKETFTMRDATSHQNKIALWPDADFRDVAVDFFERCRGICAHVMEGFARSLKLPHDFFVDKHTGLTQTLRLLHYPPAKATAEEQLGAGAHTDYGSCTLVFQDDSGGLEVQGLDGQWVPAPPIEGTVVVNTGDLLARWTNDVYKSTPHRVKVRPEGAANGRLSVAFFNDPDPEVMVEVLDSCTSADNPAKYPPITAHDHILERIAASNA